VTGGTGFFGKSVLDAFQRGLLDSFGVARIIVLARQATRLHLDVPWLCGQAVELVDGDVLNLRSTFDADFVIHAAASSDARRYQADPEGEMHIIAEGTRRVCEAMAKSSGRPRLLHVSSGAVYGRQPPGLEALAEDAPLVADADPVKQAYTQAKRQAEALVSELAATHGVPTRIARCFAFVGNWLPRDQHFAIGNFIGAALRSEPVVVNARHPVVRSYLHADDLAVWLMRLATAPGQGCEVFNVGSDEAVTIRQLAALVAELGGVGMSLPEAVPGGAEASQTDRYVPDVSKARNELGLKVTVPLRDAIQRTLRELAPKYAPQAGGMAA
jgi:dTDP-glucose 4,6-dehydratase